MKRIFLIVLIFPLFSIAQTGSPTKKAIKAKPQAIKVVEAKPADEYLITGEVTGFADGTKVALINGNTGTPETETTISKNQFTLKGKISAPDFKIVLFDNQPPYVTIFLDNSPVKIKGSKGMIDKAVVTGSPANDEYQAFNQSMLPYGALFSENAPYDAATTSRGLKVCEDFITNHPKSYTAALALIRYHQIDAEAANLESLFNKLAPEVKVSSMGNYVSQQIEEAKKNAFGSLLPDFTQADTSGNNFSLSSLRGKYVLVDFWASWCRPCRQENPNVVANFTKFKDKNFTVLGVSLDKAKPAWIEAINMDGLTWNHVSDLQGWGNVVAKQFQIFSIPQNFLIDPNGKIIGKNLRGAALERKLSRLLH